MGRWNQPQLFVAEQLVEDVGVAVIVERGARLIFFIK